MSVAHKNLAGTDLHEPKGIASAGLNTVYVCTSAGVTGTWQKIDVGQLTGAGKAFQGQLFHAIDRKSNGVEGGTFTNGAWRTRDLNLVKTNEISGASLSTNQITLPAGTYWVVARAPAYGVNGHKIGLRNITDASEAAIEGENSYAAVGTGSHAFLEGRITIASSKVFDLRHICQSTQSGNGFGQDAGCGTSEDYASIMIWKIG